MDHRGVHTLSQDLEVEVDIGLGQDTGMASLEPGHGVVTDGPVSRPTPAVGREVDLAVVVGEETPTSTKRRELNLVPRLQGRSVLEIRSRKDR